MRKFNKEDYELVKKYESDLVRAVESRYARNIMTVEFDEINKVYRETLNRSANRNCGGCLLQMLTSVGRLYLTFKKQLEEEEAKEKEVSQKPRSRGRRTSNKNKEDKKDVHKDKIETQAGEGNPGDVSDNK